MDSGEPASFLELSRCRQDFEEVTLPGLIVILVNDHKHQKYWIRIQCFSLPDNLYLSLVFVFSPTGVSCISVLVWVWAWVVWQLGSPSASWATPAWEAPPSSPGFSWAWSWSWSSPRCWGFTASSWLSSYLQNKCVHQHHLIHSTSKQQEQIGDFHLLPLHPVGLAGWDGNRNMLAVDLTALSSVDVIHPYCLKPSSCVRSSVYRTGMKGWYWLLWDDVWTVCLICCLILTCTVFQSPSTLVNVVTSLCCECEYQR